VTAVTAVLYALPLRDRPLSPALAFLFVVLIVSAVWGFRYAVFARELAHLLAGYREPADVWHRPVALYPATSESEKVSFNQLNRKTGHRIKYAKVDADTGEEVANEDIVKGYKVDTEPSSK
jgi:hypothetical protein